MYCMNVGGEGNDHRSQYTPGIPDLRTGTVGWSIIKV